MDKCKNIQDLILTDYLDNQMEVSARQELENHLHSCPACQAFASQARELVQPFEKSERQTVPSNLWINIQQQIQEEAYSKQTMVERFKEWLGTLTLPKLVPALVSFTMIFLVSSTLFFNQQIEQAKNQEAGSYVAYVLAFESNSNLPDGGNLDTPIEKYFL